MWHVASGMWHVASGKPACGGNGDGILVTYIHIIMGCGGRLFVGMVVGDVKVGMYIYI